MQGRPIEELNKGLVVFRDELAADGLASLRVEIAIVTFGGSVDVRQDFITAGQFQPPTLTADGDTPMGGAIMRALDMLGERKEYYKAHGLAYYRPWIFLITDGGPTDGDLWRTAAARVRTDEDAKRVAFFAVGVEDANLDVLRQIGKREPLQLTGLRFRDMFMWLSGSLSSSGVSGTAPGSTVKLTPPSGWAEV